MKPKRLLFALPLAIIWAASVGGHFITIPGKEAWFWMPYSVTAASAVVTTFLVAFHLNTKQEGTP